VTRSRRSLRIAGWACASLLASLLAVEIVARVGTRPPEYVDGFPFDGELGFRPQGPQRFQFCDGRGPYPFVLNADGFRGPELPAPDAPRPEGRPRLVFFGDSFLYGWSVREEALLPFSTRTALAARGIEAESYCLASSGYGTGQELLLLRRHAQRLRPDVVVLCLYTGNDLADNTLELAGRTTVSTGAWVRPYFVLDEEGTLEPTYLHPWRAALRRWSRAFTLLDHRHYRWRYQEQGQYLRADLELGVAERVRAGLAPSSELELLREPAPGDPWDQAWRTTEALLAAFQREVEGLGARLVVAVIPHVMQVEHGAIYRQLESSARAAGDPEALARLDWNLPERRLRSIFARQGIEGILLLEPLRAAHRASGESSYLHDYHLSSLGHERAGQLVATRLAELLGGARAPVEEPEASAPVDALALLGPELASVRYDTATTACIGPSWIDWACDWAGLGPGWMMKREGWLVLRRGQRYVLEAALPPTATFPVRVSANLAGRRDGEPRRIDAPGAFEIPVDLTGIEASAPRWTSVLLRSSARCPGPGGQPVGLVLKAVRRDG